MLYDVAVPSTGKTVLVIKENKVIGKGSAQLAVGTDFVGIRFTEGEILEMTKDLTVVKIFEHKHAYFRYSPVSGAFIGSAYDKDREDEFDVLQDTTVVDEFNLKYRMVPEHFKDVPGYGAVMDELEGE